MKTCENCNKEHDGKYASGRFCSKKCAKGFSTKSNRKEINKKVSETFKSKPKIIKEDNCTCDQCGNSIYRRNYDKNKHYFCSKRCATIWKNINLNMGNIGGKASVQAQKEKRRSKNEVYLAELCKSYFKNVTENDPIFNGWDADIILHKEKLAILWNGRWHYEKITKQHSVKQVQNRDEIKTKEIINAGYKPYIIKDMGKYNKLFVENEFEKLKIHCGVE